jgi:SOS response regulatory protein OraA/RecX
VSKSGYYSHKCKTSSEKTFVEKEVINCFEKHNGNYGRIRIKKALEEIGIFVSEAKISRILKENELVAKVGRKRKSKKNKPTDE